MMAGAHVCNRMVGFGSHRHVVGQLCVKSLDTLIPVSGINVEKNGWGG